LWAEAQSVAELEPLPPLGAPRAARPLGALQQAGLPACLAEPVLVRAFAQLGQPAVLRWKVTDLRSRATFGWS